MVVEAGSEEAGMDVESVKCDGRDRRGRTGGSGRLVEGAGLGDGSRNASREERRRVGDAGAFCREELAENRSENEKGVCCLIKTEWIRQDQCDKRRI